MSKEKTPIVEHMGFKYLHLVLALVLGAIWTLFSFFGWITGIAPQDLTSYAYGIIGVTVYLMFAFIWQILWKFFGKVSWKLTPNLDDPDLGFKYLHLVLSLILGVIWAVFNFFSWLPGVTPVLLITFAYGLVGLTIYLLFAFIWHILWAFFHTTSEKM
jgi:hypothetical protein